MILFSTKVKIVLLVISIQYRIIFIKNRSSLLDNSGKIITRFFLVCK